MRYGLILFVCILVAILATCLGDAARNSGSGGGKGRTGTGVARVGRRKANKVASTTTSSADVSAAKPEGAVVDKGAAPATNVRRKCRKDSDGNCIKRKTDRSRNRNARRKKNSKRRQDVSSTPSSASASQAAGAPSVPTAAPSV